MMKIFYKVRWVVSWLSGQPVSFGEFIEEDEEEAIKFVKKQPSKERKWCKIVKVTEEELEW